MPTPLRSPVYLLLGIGSALVGLLPWLITGMRLPLQNLWAEETVDMPVALLPFSQYYVFLIVGLLVVGSTVAGVVARATRAEHPRAALLALGGGVLVVQVVALAQTAIAVSGGLRDHPASTVYLGALVGGTVAAILLGLGILLLVARAPRPGALIGLSFAAIAFGSWLSGLLFPIGTVISASPLTSALSAIVGLAPALAIGLGIAWCGIRTVGRVIAAITALIVLWIGPTLTTAVSAAVGSRVLAKYPAEMLDYGVGVFRMALGMPDLWLQRIALAVAVAFIGLVARSAVRRRAALAR